MKPGACDCGTRDERHYAGCEALDTPQNPNGTRLISCPSQCGDEHYVSDARETAYLWHGGQASPLYAFASTGTVLPGLSAEAESCRKSAEERRGVEGKDMTDDEADACNIMADICTALEADLPSDA